MIGDKQQHIAIVNIAEMIMNTSPINHIHHMKFTSYMGLRLTAPLNIKIIFSTLIMKKSSMVSRL